MDWALITWGILIGIVGLLWIMVVAVRDRTTTRHSDDADSGSKVPDEGGQHQEQYERHVAA